MESLKTGVKEGNECLNFESGPSEEELIGLHLVDRTRMRGGPNSYETMDITCGLGMFSEKVENVNDSDIALSGMDCSTSSSTKLAKLVKQAIWIP